MCLIFSQTVWGSSGDEEKVSCWWVEARCSYHVTLFGSESLWDWGGHKHSDKRGEKRRIKEEEGGREVGWFGGGGETAIPRSLKNKDTSHILPPKYMCESSTMDTLAKVPRSVPRWRHFEGLDASLSFSSGRKRRFVPNWRVFCCKVLYKFIHCTVLSHLTLGLAVIF